MSTIISHNIISPLGFTTEENYAAVRRGESGVSHLMDYKGLPFEVQASVFSEEQWDVIRIDGNTDVESLALTSIRKCLCENDINLEKTIFILSSTKGDVSMLDKGEDTPLLGATAKNIAKAIGIETEPIVVCNACISGLAAMYLAKRLLDSEEYEYAIVCGVDVLSRFVVSGFESFMSLSKSPCRPFDIERNGLNLGEAAATVIMTNKPARQDLWHITSASIRNDAYHISAPHPKGEGAMMAINDIIEDIDREDLAVVGVHGTATMYNDQMESKALERSGLKDTMLSALKGYYGHTLGAAGILETIITARALDDGIILPSKGFSEIGVSGKVTISSNEETTDKRTFIKMLSGFGGCNCTALFNKGIETGTKSLYGNNYETIRTIHISSDEKGGADVDSLKEIYKNEINDYPKFYKMDALTRLAFVATERLLKGIDLEGSCDVVLFNRSSSVIADRQYEATISSNEDYFPSPSVFVYTLPNITTGEIAIRHGLKGETSFYILSEYDSATMDSIIRATLSTTRSKYVVCGWIDYPSHEQYICELKLITYNL